MSVVLALILLFCVLLVLSWILVIPIAIIGFLIKIAPFVIIALLIWALLTGRIEITIHRDKRR